MDKRRFCRFDVNLEVRYRILESLKVYETTSAEDMCEGGIKINLPEYLEPETRLELTVKIPKEAYPIMAIGKVVWVKSSLSADYFTTGIQLVYIKEKDKKMFYKYALL